MRIIGRTLRPATMAERRLLLSLGAPYLKVARDQNPFIIARRLRRLARMGASILALPDPTQGRAA